VNHYLPLQQTIPVFEFLTLYRTFNQGIAFSILSHAGVVPIVTVRLIIVACAIWIWAHRSDKSRMGDTGYSLIIAGALGNVMDAFFYGQVVDFILLHTAGLSFAVFNAADVFISVGVSCLFFDQWFGQRGRTA
jgi:signal peptidase II